DRGARPIPPHRRQERGGTSAPLTARYQASLILSRVVDNMVVVDDPQRVCAGSGPYPDADDVVIGAHVVSCVDRDRPRIIPAGDRFADALREDEQGPDPSIEERLIGADGLF